MEVVTLASLIALVNKLMSVLKAATNRQWNTVVTQAGVWIIGFAVLTLAAHAMITEHIVLFSGVPELGKLDAASLTLAGLSMGSLGSLTYDFKKARDNADAATEPPLLGPPAAG